jgi:hypothetical protein
MEGLPNVNGCIYICVMKTNTLIKNHLKKQISLQKKLIKEVEKHFTASKNVVDAKYLKRLKKDLKSFESQLGARTDIAWNY